MIRLLRLIVLAALLSTLIPSNALAAPAAAPMSATVVPTSVNLTNKIRVSFLGVEYATDGSSTWRYQVEELAGAGNLTAWALALPSCATFVSATPADGVVQNDPALGFNGVRWPVAAGWTKGEFSVTVSGTVSIGSANVAAAGTAVGKGAVLGPVCDAAFPRTITLSNGYRISLVALVFVGAGVFRWRYVVEELPSAQDLSNWVLELKNCAIVTAAPEPWEVVKPDPNAKLYGVKWQTGAGFDTGEFSVTTRGVQGIGITRVAAKGPDVVQGQIIGAICGATEDKPPAVIIIDDDDIDQDIEIINGIVFVNISITILNTGGGAKGVFLVVDLDVFKDFDLDDLKFLENIGYVERTEGKLVYIGLGKNNAINGGEGLKLKLKFKAKKSSIDIKVSGGIKLIYGDSEGGKSIDLPVVVVVPVIVPVPIGSTPVITPTNPITGTNPVTGTKPVTVTLPRLPIAIIDVRFRTIWERRGGLLIFGLPLSEPVTLPNGLIVQYFERARLEYHPNLRGTPYEVQFGLLAVELGYSRPPSVTAPPTNAADRAWYYPATGHVIASPFRNYWGGNGGLSLFGLPISPVLEENGLQVQYFERARLESHPENRGTRYEVLLGLLGEQALRQR